MGTFPNCTFKDKELARLGGAKGGAVRSMRKKLAAQIRYAKQTGFTQRKCDSLVEMLCDADVFDFQIAKYIKESLDDPKMKLTSRVRADLIGKLTDLRKVAHGSKDKAVNVNIMNQFDNKMDEFIQQLEEQENKVIDIDSDCPQDKEKG